MGGMTPPLLNGRVAVTPRSLSGGHAALDRLTAAGLEVVLPAPSRTPTQEELVANLPGCVAYLAGVEPVTSEVIAAGSDLRVIARNGVGVDNIDLEAARAAGIAVRPTPGANARGVAELAVGLLFATARHLPWSDGRLKEQRWERRIGRELAGCTLGLLGLGNVGRRVADLACALGMDVVGHDPFTPVGWQPPQGFRWAELDQVVSEADFLSLHLPAGPTPLIDAAVLGLLRPGAVLINTARSELVDEEEVLKALDDGTLSAYAVDAFATEPPSDWTLASHPRVVATPHIGGFTRESVERAALGAVEAILDELGLSDGQRFPYPR